MKAFLAALKLLTSIPVPKIEVSKNDWKKSPVYFPLIGLLIGDLLKAMVVKWNDQTKLFTISN